MASGRDWVGLYRHDTPDESWMTTRQVTLSRQGAASGPGHGTVTGEIKFHAPPSIGKYDVRYFQGHNSQRLRQKNKSRGGADENVVVEADMDRAPVPYSVRDLYYPGDRLAHPKLGEGVVQRQLGPNKIDVKFDGENKVLVMGRA